MKATDRYELYLKVLLTPIEPLGPFVQSYLLLLTDFNQDHFCDLLEVKGITRKSDQQAFIEEFLKHVPPTPEQLNDQFYGVNNALGNANFNRNDTDTLTTTSALAFTAASSLFSRLKSSFNVVNVIKRSYTRPIQNASSDGLTR